MLCAQGRLLSSTALGPSLRALSSEGRFGASEARYGVAVETHTPVMSLLSSSESTAHTILSAQQKIGIKKCGY